MSYSINARGWIVRDADGAFIPADPGNSDYAAYLVWVAEGNTAPLIPVDPATAWRAYQATARAALDESDVTLLRCFENSVTVPAEWGVYRKALRSIVGAATGDPSQPVPIRPAYPAGT